MTDSQMILAARPVRIEDFPAAFRPELQEMFKAVPLDPGWLDLRCEQCGMEVRIGPRQRTQWELSPNDFIVLDLLCAAQMGDMTKVESLGGR